MILRKWLTAATVAAGAVLGDGRLGHLGPGLAGQPAHLPFELPGRRVRVGRRPDDGGDDHNGNAGHSFRSSNGPAGITFTFDRNALRSLPKRVGAVWTDGDGQTLFEAFDAQGGSLGTIGPLAIADGSHAGTIGVLGPTRMNYPQAMAAVAIVSARLGRHLREG